jgi:hypothetical protein
MVSAREEAEAPVFGSILKHLTIEGPSYSERILFGIQIAN